MKRTFPPVLALFVILVLTALLRNGMQPGPGEVDTMQRALDRFENAQHMLRRDVISVRAGLLRSYDPIVEDVDALYAALAPLDRMAQTPANKALIEDLQASARRQEALTEALKSDSALLQNSLAYFSTLSASDDLFDQANVEAGRLTGAMLRLTLNTSSDTQALVDRRIADFAAGPGRSGRDREARAVLLSHARLLRQLLPETDARLTALLAEDDVAARAQLRAWISHERVRAETRAQRYRNALYATAVLLTVVLAGLGVRLAVHMANLKRRGAFERGLAEMSAEIVAARPEEVKARFDSGLARLALHAQADAAFLFGEGDYGCARIWPRPYQGADPDWAPAARALAGLAQRRADGVFRGAATWPWPEGQDAAPRRANIVAMVLVNEHGDHCVLGFARFEGRVQIRDADLGVMRLALDVLAGGVRRSRMEQQRSALEVRLQQAGRTEAIGTFAGGIAHNFNNILSAIAGYVEMASAIPKTPRAVTRYVEQIGVAVGRARRLVDLILLYGARSSPVRQRVDLRALLGESVSLLSAAHGQTATFAIEAGEEDYRVLGDPSRLQQIILNLASNAVQAMGGNGQVALTLGRRVNRAPVEKTSGVLLAGDYVVLSVVDHGVGMSAATRSRIFEPFFTTRPEGNGLGLATTAETARELGGAVNVRSVLGSGSTFEVWLPAGGQAPVGAVSAPGRGETVLLLSDSESLCQDEERIAALGYEPVGFVEIERAIAALRAWPQRFDAMVARTNRAECAIALRQAAPALGLILLSDTRLRANAPLRTLAASLPNSRLLSGSLTATDLAEVIAQAPTATGGV
ncbi:two-component system VirA-like sensor kinase [Caulobacter sp. UNC279MFTsu5.1]|uniref:two-component system VirA-like sensor kinase n=1 Tax=Caulobacter sp. UNC279MFTsu5.1 TaxID=1502775 RepID=UPI0008F01B80|nr:two-component system VirA-like sensor kinase [Caulobacter sp. UNC279MFTsu5.1]SFI53887.1 Histidine kinase-, DNA gyrase B-, and HSP90-like ATPase [Caulobacter sp. UNC279MFTsu5.1]